MVFERCLQFAVSCSQEISAPPHVVWAVISNIANLDKVQSNVTLVEILSAPDDDVGVVVDPGGCNNDDNNNNNRTRRGQQVAVRHDENTGEGDHRTRTTDANPTATDDNEGDRSKIEYKYRAVCVGMRFRVHRVWKNGRAYHGDWVVTHLRTPKDGSDGGGGRNADLSTDFMRGTSECLYTTTYFTNEVAGGVTGSCTWSISPSTTAGSSSKKKGVGNHHDHDTIDDSCDRCTLTVSYALVPLRLCLSIGFILCSCPLRQNVMKLASLDLEEIGAFAEAKYAAASASTVPS
jgi:hypothetical protein